MEWPLARTTEEAVRLAELARQAGVRHAVGLQARFAPAVNYARELHRRRVRRPGAPLRNVLVARGKGAAEAMPRSTAYTLNRDNGAGILEVSGGHTLDALEHILGSRLTSVSARLSVQRPAYTIEESGETVQVTSPDQILVHAALDSGAMVSAHLHDAKLTSGRTRLEIAGTEGDLVIETTGNQAPMGIQISDLRLDGSRGPGGTYREMPVPDRFRHVPAGIAADAVLNVAQLYSRLADDIHSSLPRTCPILTRPFTPTGCSTRSGRLIDQHRHHARPVPAGRGRGGAGAGLSWARPGASVVLMPTWPAASYAQWQATCDTLHAHTQLLGKLAARWRRPSRSFSTARCA